MLSTRQGALDWNTALALYAAAQVAAGRASGTIRLHRHYLTTLAASHRWPWAVTTMQLVAFLAVEHWRPETRKSARAAVRGFYRWGHGSGYLEDDPAAEPLGNTHPPDVGSMRARWAASGTTRVRPP